MPRFFNTAGPCKPEIHYVVDPLPRLPMVRKLIDGQHFFLLHAPRQTGKTTYLYALMNQLNREGAYSAITVNIQSAASGRDPFHAMMLVSDAIYKQAQLYLPEEEWPDPVEKPDPSLFPFGHLGSYLRRWAERCPKPIVLFFDEADSLTDDILVAFLRQLRAGFESRPRGFPHSIALVGLKDVRNYKIRGSSEGENLDVGYLFNIKTKSIFMNTFALSDLESLLTQHTAETGQLFCQGVRDEIFRLTQGQPWLINALVNQIVSEILENDYSEPIMLIHVEQAKDELILQRDAHLDSLISKLKVPAVKNVVEAVISGGALLPERFNEDLSYIQELGLVTPNPPIKFSNPMYAEMIPRALNYPWQVSFNQDIVDQSKYVKDGRLNMDALLSSFQRSYSRYSDVWLEKFDLRDAARQLLLMAFIQRIVDVDGVIEREMAMGSGRCDLLIEFGSDRFVLELMLQQGYYYSEEGLKQTILFLERMGMDHGYLVLFETNPEVPWEKRIYRREVYHNGKRISLIGM